MANTYLTRTPSSTTNRKTWTWSGWVKRSNITSYKILFSSYSDNNNYTRILFWDTQQLTVSSKVAGSFPIDYGEANHSPSFNYDEILEHRPSQTLGSYQMC